MADAVIGTDSTEIAFDGTTLTAAGEQITVYSLQGIAVATGNGSLSVADLNSGVYVAVAGKGTLKFIVR